MYAEVIVDIAHTAVDKRFTYRIPEALPVSVGHHVLVPFGAGDRVDIVFHFVQDSYNGLQFLVRDMRLAAAP